jgi:uncharacterized membrane protein YccC
MAHAPTARRIIALVLPSAAALRHAARLSIAALFASEFIRLMGLEQGYWAVITAIIVVQGSQNGTVGAALDRLFATIAGGVLGVAVVWTGVALHVPEPVRLIGATVPFAVLAMQRSSFRLAPLTAAIVVMISGNGEEAIFFALDRLLEISIGSAIGVATAHLVLPGPARATIRDGAASTLAALGEIAMAHLSRRSAKEIEPLGRHVRHHLSQMNAASKEEEREHRLHMSAHPPAAPLLRTLRRLQDDVTIFARLMVLEGEDGPDRSDLGVTVRAQFDAATESLREHGDMPSLSSIDAAIGEREEASPWHFALLTLRRDLADLHERLEECLPATLPCEGFRPWMPLGA